MAEKVLKSAFWVEFHDFPQKCLKYTKVALKHVFGGAGEVATEWLRTFLQPDHDLGHRKISDYVFSCHRKIFRAEKFSPRVHSCFGNISYAESSLFALSTKPYEFIAQIDDFLVKI